MLLDIGLMVLGIMVGIPLAIFFMEAAFALGWIRFFK